MNEKNSFNDEQLKRIIQDLKTVLYTLEGLQIKPKTTIDSLNNQEIILNDTPPSNITSYHRFDDQIKESVDEILICDTGKLNNDDMEENLLNTDDYDRKFLREQTNYLMKELQVAIEGKKQEWNEREQLLLGNIENTNDKPIIEEEKKQDIDYQTFEKLSSMPTTMSMLDELKHTFVLNREKLNIREDIFGENEEIFDEDEIDEQE